MYVSPPTDIAVIVFSVLDGTLKALLNVERRDAGDEGLSIPRCLFAKGRGALENAATKILTAVVACGTALPHHLEQLCTFYWPADGAPVVVAYVALVHPAWANEVPVAPARVGVAWYAIPTADVATWAQPRDVEILRAAVTRLRGKIDYAPLAFTLAPKHFTVAELRTVYEAIKGTTFDPSNFRRRFKRMLKDGVIQHVEGHRATATKPAAIYRFVPQTPPEAAP